MIRQSNTRMRHALVVVVASFLTATHPALGLSKTVLKEAPPTHHPCIQAVFDDEASVPIPFTRLCQLNDVWTALFGMEDATNQALAKVKKAACGCGANALIILTNTSSDGRSRRRHREEIDAIAIHLDETALRRAERAPRPRAPSARPAWAPGFGTLIWGDANPSDMVAEFDRWDGEENCYSRPGDRALVDELKVDAIYYCFIARRLREVLLPVPQARQAEALNAARQLLGNPSMKDGTYAWTSPDGKSGALFQEVSGPDTWLFSFIDLGYWSSREAQAPRRKGGAASSGTGLIVSLAGDVVTNQHVVDSCQTITVNGSRAALVSVDAVNDLALLRLNESPKTAASFRSGRIVRAGEEVMAIGFPLPSVLSSELKVTAGSISSLSGPGNDSRFMQISAPVQPGNSGGPLLDGSGNVVGVVQSSLKQASQNVNFAIAGSVVKSFLDSSGVRYKTADLGIRLPGADVADKARTFTVRVVCQK